MNLKKKKSIRVNEHTFPKYKAYYTELLRRQWNKHKNPGSRPVELCRTSRSLQLGLSRLMCLQLVKLHLWYQFCTYKEPSTAEAVIPHPWTRTSPLLKTWLGLLNRDTMGLTGAGSGMKSLGRHAFTLSGGLAFDEVGLGWQASIRSHLLKPLAILPELY